MLKIGRSHSLSLCSLTVSLSCGAMTSENCTFLVQMSVTATDPDPCAYTICRCAPNVCRIRLDFTVLQKKNHR